MRWILGVFLGLVVGLCLLCDRDSAPVRARREVTRIEMPQPGVPVAHKPEDPAPRKTALASQQPDAAPVPEAERDAPPSDPIEEGDCSLFLSLTSAETGKAIRSRVNLYRLGAPGNEHWLPGDQRQCRVLVPESGAWIHRLPAGLYRIHAEAQRYESDDPSRFEVAGSVTERQFAIPMPRKFRVDVVIVDERGRPIEAARRRQGFSSYTHRSSVIPWLQERKLRHPERYQEFFGFGAGGRVGGRNRWRDVEAENGAFPLGDFWEDTRRSRRTLPWQFRIEGRTQVRVSQKSEPGRDQTYMALSLPMRTIREAILLPDGRVATEASITTRSEAVLVAERELSGFWRTLTVSVQVNLDGFKPLEFTATADKPLEISILEPIEGALDE